MSSEFNQVNKLKNVIRSSRVKDTPNDGKFIERLIKISRVTKVTKGGKKIKLSCCCSYW
jgi:ribosomal protein S5